MSANTFATVRAIIVIVISLFIMLRAFQVYFQTRTTRLLVLGLTMVMIILTTTADVIGNNITFHLNAYWFNYVGQTISFAFFYLSLINSSEKYLRNLVRWQIALSALLFILLLEGPALPHTFPTLGLLRAIFSSGRALPCFLICLYYFAAFVKKETCFSLLMGAGFVIIGLGYYMIFPRYVNPPSYDIQTTGDILRIIGNGILLVAMIWG
jgi:hypothetical protein